MSKTFVSYNYPQTNTRITTCVSPSYPQTNTMSNTFVSHKLSTNKYNE